MHNMEPHDDREGYNGNLQVSCAGAKGSPTRIVEGVSLWVIRIECSWWIDTDIEFDDVVFTAI